jgi:hypothetical protein
MTKRCPHCGNIDSKYIEDNGESANSPDLTLLCTRPVEPEDWSFAEKPADDFFDDDGRVPCGMQWEPNQ